MSKRLAKKVLVIGWDAADWKVINPLLDQGLMPALESLINKGAMGHLATLDPPLSPILWTSIATGKTADKHGILNFIEPDPATSGLRPVSVTSRKIKAVWNILTQEGFKTHLVGWWPSHPAEPINGVCVSNMFQKQPKSNEDPWPVPAGSVHPKELEDTLSEFRVRLDEITASMILPFVPGAAQANQENDGSIHAIAHHLAEASSLHAASTWILENKEWDFMGVYFDTIDHFCHGFMRFHPPQMEGIPDNYYALYKDVVNSAYRFQDMMLERTLQLAGDDTTVIILSDHGFHSDHLRPKKLPKEPIAPALEHSPYGIICMAGPNILEDERIFGATLLDITPTILTLFGLPIGKDMDGQPLLQAFKEDIQPDYIDSWETVQGECGMHPPDLQEDPWAAQAAMQQLIELGYVEGPEADMQERIRSNKNETDFILAKVYAGSRRHELAIPILESLYKENPSAARYGLKLAHCFQITRNIKGLRELIEDLRKKELKELPDLDFLEGTLLLFENKPRRALEMFRKAEQTISHMPFLHIQIGNVYNKIRRWADAERAFKTAVTIDINNPYAYHGLGMSYLRQYEYELAADAVLNAISLNYHFPEAHYHLGEILMNMKDYERAAQAFEVSIAMMPGFKKAHEWLVKLYDGPLAQPEKAERSRQFIKEKIKGTITIVTGLPRSGTSMMMQMLKAGGIQTLTDGIRKDDENNPKGYLEFEQVKKLALDNSWVHEAEGKAIKVISHLLPHLPSIYNYKILFMQRDMSEILKSQQKMLGKDPNVFPSQLAETFRKQLKKTESWLAGQPNMDVLYVNYRDIIEHPEEQAENIASFLGAELNTPEMCTAIDKDLYRNKV
ncbi:MAG TPA: alkaline phosphatase family protein [Bacteroidia bacterium]|jgi:predicted AlkP superfamily phosphohydrolase/phosphomutase/Flp pilus assembly protein TadD